MLEDVTEFMEVQHPAQPLDQQQLNNQFQQQFIHLATEQLRCSQQQSLQQSNMMVMQQQMMFMLSQPQRDRGRNFAMPPSMMPLTMTPSPVSRTSGGSRSYSGILMAPLPANVSLVPGSRSYRGLLTSSPSSISDDSSISSSAVDLVALAEARIQASVQHQIGIAVRNNLSDMRGMQVAHSPFLTAGQTGRVNHCIYKFGIRPSDTHETLDSGAGVPHHMFGILSDAFPNENAAYATIHSVGVCRFCRNSRNPVPCAFLSANRSDGSCLCCMITGGNDSKTDEFCAQCVSDHSQSSTNRDFRGTLLTTLLSPLMHKLRYTLPSYELLFDAEKRTAGHSTTGNGWGEGRFDFLVTAKSGPMTRAIIAIELISTADITPSSLKNKLSWLRSKYDSDNAKLILIPIYVSKQRPLTHLVMLRQIVNALIVNAAKLPDGETSSPSSSSTRVHVYTSGADGGQRTRWTPGASGTVALRVRGDNLNVRHLETFFCPVSSEHSWKYCIHPKEISLLKERTMASDNGAGVLLECHELP